MKDSKKIPLTKAKKRQLLTAGAIFIVVALLSWVTAITITNSKKDREASQKPQPKIEKSDFSKPDVILEGPAIWQANRGAQQDLADKRIEELTKEVESLKNEKSNNKQVTSLPEINLSKSLPPAPPSGLISSTVGSGGNVDSSFIQSIDLSRSSFNTNSSSSNGLGTAKNSNVPNSAQNFNVKGVRPNLVVTEDGGNVEYLNRNSNSASTSTGRFRAQKSYIPSGTFFRAILLGGLDAPTGGESSTANPHPVLLRINNMAQLPNRFRQNFKECFVTGTGYGDLSSERAMIRTEQLSCVGTDGRAIDIAIKGYVAGEDGKTGVRGRLVSKQGSVLKNALIAGVLSGIGEGFSSAASVTNTSALGSVSSVSSGKQWQNALGTGAGNAFDKLAQYYIKLADKMFPVIEVDAGRQVDIVLIKGFQIGDE